MCHGHAQETSPRGAEVDHGAGVVSPELDARSLEYGAGGFEGGVDVAGRQPSEFGHIAADVLPLWIELLALGHGIEHSKVGGCVNPRTCAPLPAHVICGVVAVCEMFEI